MPGFEYDVNIDFNKILISKSQIENFLPPWKTKITEVYRYKNNNWFEINILVAANSETEVQQWIHEYEEKSKCSYSIRSTEKCSGTKVQFKQRLKCVHNTRPKNVSKSTSQKKSKNSNCPSTITVTLRTVRNKYKGKNKSKAPDPSMPCEIKILPYHNHSPSGDTFVFRKVKNETREKLVNLFESGYSPANALECLKMDIRLKHDNFYELLVDRSDCPDYMYCYKLYLSTFKQKSRQLEASPDFFQQKVDQFNKDTDTRSAAIKFIDKDCVICLCPPLMKRVHETIEEASQIVFLDSTRTADHSGQRIFVLLTPSQCGDLPLAIFITTSECAQLISVGFQLLKEIMGDRIFYGNIKGPKIFMTGDLAAVHAAIQSEWPKSTNLLCIFQMLRFVWRCLMKITIGINQEHLNGLFQEFRSIMFADNEEKCTAAFEIAITGSKKFPQYQSYLNNYWNRRSLWALCYRKGSRQGQDTNNLLEAAMRLMKANIYERIKSYNMVEVVDFVMTRFVSYYERRLLDAAHNITVPNILHRLITMPPSADEIEHIQRLTDGIDLVSNEKETYIVNSEVLSCTCTQGRKANMCKHIDWIYFVKSDDLTENIDDETTRRAFFFIATGSKPPKNWLEPSCGESSSLEEMEDKFPTNITETIKIIWEPSDDNLEQVDEKQYILKGTETTHRNKSTPNYPLKSELIFELSDNKLEQVHEKQCISKGGGTINSDKSSASYTETIEIICKPSADNLETANEKQYISKGSDIVNGNKFTTNNTENIEIIWEPPFDNLEKTSEEEHISKGRETINGMSEMFSEYLKRSPLEISKALKVLYNGLKTIKTVSGFGTACHNFSSGIINRRKNSRCEITIPPTAISWGRTNLSGKRDAGRRFRKCGTFTRVRSRKQVFPKRES